MSETYIILCGKKIMITEEIRIQMDVEGTLFNQFEYMRGYHTSTDIWPKP